MLGPQEGTLGVTSDTAVRWGKIDAARRLVTTFNRDVGAVVPGGQPRRPERIDVECRGLSAYGTTRHGTQGNEENWAMSNQLGKRVARLMAAAPFLFVLACGGCGHSHTFKTGPPSPSTRVTETEQQGLFGWVRYNVYDLDKACPNGVSEFGSYISFTNWLPSFFTLGLYTPRPRTPSARKEVRNESHRCSSGGLLGRDWVRSAPHHVHPVVSGGEGRVLGEENACARDRASDCRWRRSSESSTRCPPALVDYTGPVNTADVCPDGIHKVSHHHAFWQSLLAWG